MFDRSQKSLLEQYKDQPPRILNVIRSLSFIHPNVTTITFQEEQFGTTLLLEVSEKKFKTVFVPYLEKENENTVVIPTVKDENTDVSCCTLS